MLALAGVLSKESWFSMIFIIVEPMWTMCSVRKFMGITVNEPCGMSMSIGFFLIAYPPPPGPLVSKGPFQKIVSHLQKPLEFLGGYVYISFRGMILWLFRLLVSARFLTILCIGAKAITLAAWMMMQRQPKGEMGSLARKRFMSLEQINLTWELINLVAFAILKVSWCFFFHLAPPLCLLWLMN